MIPNWLKSYIQESDIVQIGKAVGKAELTTSGEIVPVIVQRSTAVRSLPMYIYIIFFILFNVLVDRLYHQDYFSDLYLSLGFYILGLIILIPASYFLSKVSVVQRALIHPLDLEQQSYQRALYEFYNLGLNKTDGSTGILLFVSVLDRQVIILADKSINDLIPKNTWSEIQNKMVENLKNKDMARGFTDAIHDCGEILTAHFPSQIKNINELPNKLIIKD